MVGIGQQIGKSLGDVGKAATVDAAKGVAEAGKQVVERVLETGVEGLSGGMVGSGEESGQIEAEGFEDQEFQRIKMEKERAARQRLIEVQGQLEQVVRQKQAEKTQEVRAEEQEREVVEQQKEKKKKSWVRQMIDRAKRGGGTGEMIRQKN